MISKLIISLILIMSVQLESLDLTIKEEVFNKKYYPFLFCQASRQIFYGSSSSGKSKFAAQRRVFSLIKEPRNFLVVRKVGFTLMGSVIAETRRVINEWGLEKFLIFKKSEFEIIDLTTNRKIIFRGLDNVERLKSITVLEGTLTDIEIEEATEITPNDYEQLELRIRGLCSVNKRMSLFFNPIYRRHWIAKRFFNRKWIKYKYDGELLIVHSTYKDNAFLSEQDKKVLENKTGYYRDVYCLGKWGTLGNLVFSRVKRANLKALKKSWDNIRFGGDFGYTNSPTAIIKMSVDIENRVIYILDEIYERKLTNEMILLRSQRLVKNNVVWWDCEDPKSIEELQLGTIIEGERYCMNAERVKKGKNSVLFAIQWLQNFTVIIDSSCENSYDEFTTLEWMKNKNDEPINQLPLDANKHAIDAVHYGLEQDMLYGPDIGLSTIRDIEDEPKSPFTGDSLFIGEVS